MSEYTTDLKNDSEDIKLNDVGWLEDFPQENFHTFSQSMTLFIQENGYIDSPDDNDKKIKFIIQKFKDKKIEIDSRDIRNWFINSKKPQRGKNNMPFPICFAFDLDIDQTNAFFYKVYLERSFDLHDLNEVVFYFCIKTGFSYLDAKEMIAGLPKRDPASNIPLSDQALYTVSIKEIVDRFSKEQKEDFIDYLRQNIGQFQFHHKAAGENVRKLWEKIAGENGIAFYENGFKILKPKTSHLKGVGQASVQQVYLHILGLDVQKGERSTTAPEKREDMRLKPDFLRSDHHFIQLINESFPERGTIDKVLRGAFVGNEAVRKILILLVFYRFWTEKIEMDNSPHTAFSKKYESFRSTEDDLSEFISVVNDALIKSGYQELYYGNPYDWLFLCVSSQKENPLKYFREMISTFEDIGDRDKDEN